MYPDGFNCGHNPAVATPGERLDQLMRASGHTKKSLAAATGVSAQSLTNWITGVIASPRLPRDRRALADELGEDVFDTRDPAEVADAESLKNLRFLDASPAQHARRLAELLEAEEADGRVRHDQSNVYAHERWRTMPLTADAETEES